MHYELRGSAIELLCQLSFTSFSLFEANFEDSIEVLKDPVETGVLQRKCA